ncbi:MAG: hypothetical protein EBS41_02470 [Actinobacteria bacterium]|jgi:hypothetical protein|nr:hypothetical protein [Actinomycetota bacterium]
MSKERARRREEREAMQRAQAEVAARKRRRRQQRRALVQTVGKPVSAATSAGKVMWSPLTMGQTGLLARRRLRRFTAVAATLVSVNAAVYLVFGDRTISLIIGGVSLLVSPLLSTVLFGNRR